MGPGNAHLHTNGPVAQPNGAYVWPIALQGLGHQAAGVGKVDQPGVRAQPLHVFRYREDDRDGPQRIGHPAHSGGLLAHQPPASAELLIGQASAHPTHSNLRLHKGRAPQCLLSRGGQVKRKGRSRGTDHAARQTTDHLKPGLVDIHQPDLLQVQLPSARNEAANQLWRVGGSSSDYCDLHRSSLPERARHLA